MTGQADEPRNIHARCCVLLPRTVRPIAGCRKNRWHGVEHSLVFEPDLERLVQSHARAGRLLFTTDLAGPVSDAEAIFIAVGTPSRRGEGHADLSYVYAASREIAGAVRGFVVVVTKSTVPVDTGDEMERIFTQVNPSADVSVVSNPEFLREGAAVRDFWERMTSVGARSWVRFIDLVISSGAYHVYQPPQRRAHQICG